MYRCIKGCIKIANFVGTMQMDGWMIGWMNNARCRQEMENASGNNESIEWLDGIAFDMTMGNVDGKMRLVEQKNLAQNCENCLGRVRCYVLMLYC
jgi:hypothetical protein